MSYKLPGCLRNPYVNPPLIGRNEISNYLPPLSEFILTEDNIELLAEDSDPLLTEGT